jgi:hypothetical protein
MYGSGVSLLFFCQHAYADINASGLIPGKHISHNVAQPSPAKAAGEHQIIPHLHIDGNIRTYFFDREFTNPNLDNQSAFSLGGKINVLTDPFLSGFRLGGTVYTAQSLGLNSHNPANVDATLPASPVTALGQAFLQYQNVYILGRLGNQIITNPWVNEADSRMIPATYQGIKINLMPTPNLILSGMRLIRFKSRVSATFTPTNAYTPGQLGTPVPALTNKTVIGSLIFGAQYKYKTLNAQLWDYRFYNFSHLAYGDINYKFENKTIVKPIIGAQVGTQWSDGSNLLQSVGLGSTKGTVFGAMLGAEIADGKVTLNYNLLPKMAGAFRNGDIISPYSSGYISDPLYTTSMIAGLIEKASGSAAKVAAQYTFFSKQLILFASYAKYNTKPFFPSTDETDLDAIYLPKGIFKNLSLRYRVGFLNGNPATGHFVYNRVMFEYDFA